MSLLFDNFYRAFVLFLYAFSDVFFLMQINYIFLVNNALAVEVNSPILRFGKEIRLND